MTIRLRPATIADADLLLQWRNDSQTRHASHSMSIVSREDHIEWLDGLLDDASRWLLIAEEDGHPVGTARVDVVDGVHELSWTVAPTMRGRGVAKRMVAIAVAEIVGPIRAEVKVGNEASRAIAEHVGMTLYNEENGVLHYMRPE